MTSAGIILGIAVAAYVLTETIGLVRRILQQRATDRVTLELLQNRLQAAYALKTANEQANQHWNGVRKLVVTKKVAESYDTASFYLEPHDGKHLPIFRAGQFLTFRLHVPSLSKPVVRCYSISSAPDDHHYRITVRRVPDGVASNYMHDGVQEGDILDVLAPRGDFCIEPGHYRPSVLIGGGVGITPLVSMLETIARDFNSPETWLIHGVRDPEDRVMCEHLRTLAEATPGLHYRLGFSSDKSADEDPDFRGRITVGYLKEILPSSNYEFYICGPPSMMKAMVADLKEWGVPGNSIHTEAFGADSVSVVSKARNETSDADATPAELTPLAVKFTRSSVDTSYSGQAESLLELAEAVDVEIEAGCRAGSCGSCMTAIRKGTVRYLEVPGFPCDEGSCLPCVCVPSEELELDA